MSSDTVKFFEHEASGGFLLAEARLDSEPTLNALSLEMIDQLMPVVNRWALDERVAAVILTGAGQKAFSAGGDIQALYRAMLSNHQAGERVDDYPYEFFEREYRLDYRLHTYPKPLIALGHGVIMGGGLGLFGAADVRVATENVRIAMPEVTIGLFPDAGGTWLLKSLPEHQALFIGMTGAHLNAGDAMTSGIATHLVPREDIEALVDAIAGLTFTGKREADIETIRTYLDTRKAEGSPAAQLPAVSDALTAGGGFQAAVRTLAGMAGASAWVDKGIASMERGCPATVGIVVEQVRRARAMGLADCFRMEMTIATHCAENHDFAEGVRALLIEKDNKPNWQFGDLDSLPEGYVAEHFVEPWSRNPLYDLEAST